MLAKFFHALPQLPSVNRFFISALLAIIGLSVTASITFSQDGNWSAPQVLSSEVSSWFPDIATDPTGRVHVVWTSAVKTQEDELLLDAVLYTTSEDGRKWSEIVDVQVPEFQAGEATRPTLYINRQGMMHMTFRGTKVYYSHVPVDTASEASMWLAPRQISLQPMTYYSRVIEDSQGRLHLVFTENIATPECPVCYHLFYRWSDNDGLSWSSLEDISRLPAGSAKPQILIDEQDNIHVVWEAGTSGERGQVFDPTKVMYTVSYDRGATWAAPSEFIAPGGVAKNVTIGYDGEGKLLVAWLDMHQDVVYYQFSQDKGRSWSPPRPIPGVWGGWSVYATRLDDYAMATDSAGNVHLVLAGRTHPDQTSLDVIHVTWDGATWSQPEVIATYPADVPEWPRIAIGHGNELHVVWFMRDQANIWNSSEQEYKIWYAQSLSSAPRTTPVALPTVTPTPVPAVIATSTATPTLTPSPTPTATREPGLREVSLPAGTIDVIYTDMDEISLLVKSLVPTILVIALVVVGVRLRRRSTWR